MEKSALRRESSLFCVFWLNPECCGGELSGSAAAVITSSPSVWTLEISNTTIIEKMISICSAFAS
jgi:hypothetical protein